MLASTQIYRTYTPPPPYFDTNTSNLPNFKTVYLLITVSVSLKILGSCLLPEYELLWRFLNKSVKRKLFYDPLKIAIFGFCHENI